MVGKKAWEILEVKDPDECDDIGNSRFDQSPTLDRKLAIKFEKYWVKRSLEFPEKFMWIDKSNDIELRKFYQRLSDERWEKRNNGGNKK